MQIMSSASKFSVSLDRYSNPVGSILDRICHLISYPWCTVLAYAVAFYMDSAEPRSHTVKFAEKFILGPVFAIALVVTAPLGLAGLSLWFMLCLLFRMKKYSYNHILAGKESKGEASTITLASANVLLANEMFCRMNNTSNSFTRSREIGLRLSTSGSTSLNNLSSYPSKDNFIICDLPDVDILCLQEVWERFWASRLTEQLRSKYTYFISDVGVFRPSTNFCLFGSGLFVASKYPIVAAQFQPFRYRTNFARYLSYGTLSLKLRVGEHKTVYISNLHGQAYQGKDLVLYHQLSETLSSINSFRTLTMSTDDQVVLDAICGDLNFDNMSPGDAPTRRHPIFNLYSDIASKKDGVDQSWTVGTELRQRRMHEACVSTAESFRRVLMDDLRRRFYIIDADVQEQTIALASVEPEPNKDGQVVAQSWGGKRRIDRILLRKDCPAKPVGYAFSTILAGLTDHIPVCMTVQI